MAIDVHLTDTYFVIAHFHYVMVGGMVMAFLAAFTFGFRKSRPPVPEELGEDRGRHRLYRLQSDFLPAIHSRLPGNAPALCDLCREFQVLNVMSTMGASITGHRISDSDDYLTWAWRNGPISPSESLAREGLEWEQSPTPPPTFNFIEPPIVTEFGL